MELTAHSLTLRAISRRVWFTTTHVTKISTCTTSKLSGVPFRVVRTIRQSATTLIIGKIFGASHTSLITTQVSFALTGKLATLSALITRAVRCKRFAPWVMAGKNRSIIRSTIRSTRVSKVRTVTRCSAVDTITRARTIVASSKTLATSLILQRCERDLCNTCQCKSWHRTSDQWLYSTRTTSKSSSSTASSARSLQSIWPLTCALMD